MIKSIVDAPAKALGLNKEAPDVTDLRVGMAVAAVGGYIFGVHRGKTNPASNFLGL